MEQQERSKQTILIVLGSLIFILGLSSLILFFQNRLLRQQIASSQTSPSPSPMASADPTTDWKSYSKYGFSFKYPNDWILKEEGPVVPTISISNKSIEAGVEYWKDPNIYKLDIVILQGKIDDNLNTQWIEDGSPVKTLIGSNSAYRGKIKSPIGDEELILIQKNTDYLQITTLPTAEIFDQILSTFKFTDEERTFCGGIANLPCPTEGYVCEKEGDYPDAGFWCTENN